MHHLRAHLWEEPDLDAGRKGEMQKLDSKSFWDEGMSRDNPSVTQVEKNPLPFYPTKKRRPYTGLEGTEPVY